MSAAVAGLAGGERAGAARPLHVVQVSRDASLLDPARGAKPLARQRAHARELDARRPASRMTILVLTRDRGAETIVEPGLSIQPLAEQSCCRVGRPA